MILHGYEATGNELRIPYVESLPQQIDQGHELDCARRKSGECLFGVRYQQQIRADQARH